MLRVPKRPSMPLADKFEAPRLHFSNMDVPGELKFLGLLRERKPGAASNGLQCSMCSGRVGEAAEGV